MTYKWLALAALAAISVSCSRTQKTALNCPAQGKPAPDFTLKDATGQNVKLSDYKGKVVVLNFWATWCGPCKIEIPWFMGFEQQYKDRDFAVLGVSLDEDGWDSVKPYVEQKKINYRIVIGNDALDKAYGGLESLPTTFVIDRCGQVSSKHVGLVSKSTYVEEIEKLLAAPKGPRQITNTKPPGPLAFVPVRPVQ